MLTNTGCVCFISVPDPNQGGELRTVDMGNYWKDASGNLCIITTPKLAARYGKHIDCPIYCKK